MAKGNRKGSKAVKRDEVAPEVAEETMIIEEIENAESVEAVEEILASTEEIETDILDEEDETEEMLADGETKVRKPRGKRQAYYDCTANVTLPSDVPERDLKAGDTALVLEPVAVTMPLDEAMFDRVKTRLEAIEIFKDKYGVAPELINGPIYNMKGISSSPRKRETINVTVAKEAPFTSERGKAVHRFKNIDWNVLVNFTARPETVFVFYESLVDPKQAPKDKSKFQKPAPKFLPVNALRDLQKNASA